MELWHDVGTGLDRDDLLVASPIGPQLGDHYPVEVWSVGDARLLARFDTVVDFGGHRLALATAEDRLVVVAAAYDRLGVAGYDAMFGEGLWQRPNLKRAQHLEPADRLVVVSFERGPAHVLEASTGTTLATVRGCPALLDEPLRRCWPGVGIRPHRPLGHD